MKQQMSDEKLEHIYKNLTPKMTPSKTVWKNISRNIPDRKRKSFEIFTDFLSFIQYHKIKFSLSFASLIIIGTFIFIILGNNFNSEYKDSVTYQEIKKSSFEYNKAKENLVVLLNKNKEKIDIETYKTVLENIKTIDESLINIEVALKNNPEDLKMSERLAFIYNEQTKSLVMTDSMLKTMLE